MTSSYPSYVNAFTASVRICTTYSDMFKTFTLFLGWIHYVGAATYGAMVPSQAPQERVHSKMDNMQQHPKDQLQKLHNALYKGTQNCESSQTQLFRIGSAVWQVTDNTSRKGQECAVKGLKMLTSALLLDLGDGVLIVWHIFLTARSWPPGLLWLSCHLAK